THRDPLPGTLARQLLRLGQGRLPRLLGSLAAEQAHPAGVVLSPEPEARAHQETDRTCQKDVAALHVATPPSWFHRNAIPTLPAPAASTRSRPPRPPAAAGSRRSGPACPAAPHRGRSSRGSGPVGRRRRARGSPPAPGRGSRPPPERPAPGDGRAPGGRRSG